MGQTIFLGRQSCLVKLTHTPTPMAASCWLLDRHRGQVGDQSPDRGHVDLRSRGSNPQHKVVVACRFFSEHFKDFGLKAEIGNSR